MPFANERSPSARTRGRAILLSVMFQFLAISNGRGMDPFPLDTKGLPPRTLLRAPRERARPAWLSTNLRVGHLPGYNERMVREFLQAGYNVVTVNCLGTWDRVGPSARLYSAEEVKRADEYLRRVVDTIHAAGARSVLYVGPVQVPVFSKEFLAAHPDWLKVRSDGSPDPGFGNIRSGYGDWLCEQLAYVTRVYKPDGYWFDGYAPVHLHTYDDATRAAFREVSRGAEIPTTFDPVRDPTSRKYLQWHEQFFVDFADRMRDVVRRENPETVLFANYSANRTWYYPDMYMGEYPATYVDAIDVPSVELYWDVPGDALYQQFCCAFVQGVTRGRGGSVWIQPSAHGISGVASPIDIQLRGIEGAIWGVYPEFVESAGREEYLKLHLANVAARDEWWIDSEPVPHIGIVASEQTRTLFAQGALPVYFSHALGAFRAFFEMHWPIRVLTERDLEDANLLGIRVLVLPNVAAMSDRAAEVVRRFVRAGGGLIASYETSLYDDQFQRRDDFALADLFGAHYVTSHPVNQRSENLMITVASEHPMVRDAAILAKRANAWLSDGPPPDAGSLALIASAVECIPAANANVLANFQLAAPKDGSKQHPAVLASERGQGRVVYFPASFDKGMFFYPDGYMRALLANACQWCAKDVLPPLEVHGPLVLATTFRRQPKDNRLVVHLLNDHSSYGRHSIYQKLAPLPEELRAKWGFPNQSELRGTWPVREEILPLHDIRVICRIPGIRRATLEPEHLDLPLQSRDGAVEVVVPRVIMHSMVVFE